MSIDEVILMIMDPKLFYGIILGLTPWLWGQFHLIKERRIVYKWLKNNCKNEGDNRFYTTRKICNGVNLTDKKVSVACYTSTKIHRNELEEESWTISETNLEDRPSLSIEVWN